MTGRFLAILLLSILFEPTSFAQTNPCAQQPAPGRPSRIYKNGRTLCWNGAPLRMIGYGAIDLVTRDGFDTATFLNTVRFVDKGDTRKNHGANLTRVWAAGTSNSPDCFHTPIEQDPQQSPMTMPFPYLPGESCSANNLFPKYNMCISTIACPRPAGLNPNYVARLQSILSEARSNGIIVALVLFDAFFFGEARSGRPLFAKNPWNPLNNNMSQNTFRRGPRSSSLTACNNLYRSRDHSDISDDAFPEFYDICKDSSTTPACDRTLNCLGLIQKAYVQAMVDIVRTNPGGGDHVFFHIMNRPTYDKRDSGHEGFDLAKFKRWNDVVGYWIKCQGDDNCNNIRGDYLVMGEVGLALYPDLACTNPATCPENPTDVFAMKNIDLINIQGFTWQNTPGAPGPCKTATTAISRFKKPVVIDTDSAYERVNKCRVAKWASEIKTCANPGEVHLNHLDGMTLQYPRPKTCKFIGTGTPQLFLDFDERYLDCFTLDILGFGAPTYLDDIVISAPASSCPNSVDSDGDPKWCETGCRLN